MVCFTVRIRIEAKDHERAAEILRLLTASSRQESGCVAYIAHFVADDPNTILIYEHYKDQAALDAHRNSPYFKQYAAGELYQVMIERRLENLNVIA